MISEIFRIFMNLLIFLVVFNNLMINLKILYFTGELRWNIGLHHWVHMDETMKNDRQHDGFGVPSEEIYALNVQETSYWIEWDPQKANLNKKSRIEMGPVPMGSSWKIKRLSFFLFICIRGRGKKLSSLEDQTKRQNIWGPTTLPRGPTPLGQLKGGAVLVDTQTYLRSRGQHRTLRAHRLTQKSKRMGGGKLLRYPPLIAKIRRGSGNDDEGKSVNSTQKAVSRL